MKPMKLAILTNMVAPYRVPFFRELAKQPEIRKLTILTCVEKEVDREWQVNNDTNYQVKKLFGLTLNLIKEAMLSALFISRLEFYFICFFNAQQNWLLVMHLGQAIWLHFFVGCYLSLMWYGMKSPPAQKYRKALVPNCGAICIVVHKNILPLASLLEIF